MSAKPKRQKTPPKTPAQWAAERVRLNCAVGRDVIAGVTKPPGVTRTEYAMHLLFGAVSELANLIEEQAKDVDGSVMAQGENTRSGKKIRQLTRRT